MPPRNEWDLSDYLRHKHAAVQQAKRLRNEALWSVPGMLWRGGAWALRVTRRWWLGAHGERA